MTSRLMECFAPYKNKLCHCATYNILASAILLAQDMSTYNKGAATIKFIVSVKTLLLCCWDERGGLCTMKIFLEAQFIMYGTA